MLGPGVVLCAHRGVLARVVYLDLIPPRMASPLDQATAAAGVDMQAAHGVHARRCSALLPLSTRQSQQAMRMLGSNPVHAGFPTLCMLASMLASMLGSQTLTWRMAGADSFWTTPMAASKRCCLHTQTGSTDATRRLAAAAAEAAEGGGRGASSGSSGRISCPPHPELRPGGSTSQQRQLAVWQPQRTATRSQAGRSSPSRTAHPSCLSKPACQSVRCEWTRQTAVGLN